MLDRVCLGTVARKHHVALRDEANQGKLLYEHCLTRRGFDGGYTIFYERALPPRDIAHRRTDLPADPEAYFDDGLNRRHFAAGRSEGEGDHIATRNILLCNADVAIGVCRPTQKSPRYFSNADGDDLFYVQSGSGTIESVFGPLAYRPGDYILMPRGAVYRVVPDVAPEGADAGPPPLWLVIEGRRHLEIPPNFRNPWGQLRMDAPYSHRDFRRPSRLPDLSGPDFRPGRYPVLVKRAGNLHEIMRDTDPMDIVGWDGTVYPIALSIHDYQPKVGRVHLPPTTFSTFTGGGFIVCSFVPRLVDFDKDAVPCPYPHSSVDCDEVIFYSSGNFTSRRGIGPGSISHHPAGIPHGPQPGAYESSLGKTQTDELAVMVDTFAPLGITTAARSIEDPDYHASWRR